MFDQRKSMLLQALGAPHAIQPPQGSYMGRGVPPHSGFDPNQPHILPVPYPQPWRPSTPGHGVPGRHLRQETY